MFPSSGRAEKIIAVHPIAQRDIKDGIALL
jgi:hypothetical protein